MGQAARARLPRPVLHDPQHGRLRRPVQDDRVSRTYNGGPIAGPDRRARHRQAARRAQRRHRRRRRHVVRHRPRRRRLASATTSSTRSSTSGWSRRPCCSRSRSAPAAGRSRRSTTRSATGWRSGRRAPAPTRARSPTSSAAPSRRSPTPTSCSATCSPDEFFGGRMALDREAAEEAIRTQIAEPLGVSTCRGGGADPAHHRRQDGVGDPQGGDAARLPAVGVHAVRVRRRRADARGRLHGRDPARGDVPVLAGVLRVRLARSWTSSTSTSARSG